jgi:hypothetical protein
MISNDCGSRIKDGNGNNDRDRKRQTMARERGKKDVGKDKQRFGSNQN